MRIADLTAAQIESFLKVYEFERRTDQELSGCHYCNLLEDVFFKTDAGMTVTVQSAFRMIDPFALIVGFHLALNFMQAVQEAEELESLTKL